LGCGRTWTSGFVVRHGSICELLAVGAVELALDVPSTRTPSSDQLNSKDLTRVDGSALHGRAGFQGRRTALGSLASARMLRIEVADTAYTEEDGDAPRIRSPRARSYRMCLRWRFEAGRSRSAGGHASSSLSESDRLSVPQTHIRNWVGKGRSSRAQGSKNGRE